jgi:hypothetical protein
MMDGLLQWLRIVFVEWRCCLIVFCWLRTVYNIYGLGAHTQSYPQNLEHDWLQPDHLLIQACC